MDIVDRITLTEGKMNRLEKEKAIETVEDAFENAGMYLEQLEIIGLINTQRKSKIRSLRMELQKMKFDVIKDLE